MRKPALGFVVLSLLAGCADPATALKVERQQCFDVKYGWLHDFSGNNICEDVRLHDIRAFGRPSVCDFRWC